VGCRTLHAYIGTLSLLTTIVKFKALLADTLKAQYRLQYPHNAILQSPETIIGGLFLSFKCCFSSTLLNGCSSLLLALSWNERISHVEYTHARSHKHTIERHSCRAAARALDELTLEHAGAAARREVVDGRGSEHGCREGEDDERGEAGELHI
jgi:hypothetical protein